MNDNNSYIDCYFETDPFTSVIDNNQKFKFVLISNERSRFLICGCYERFPYHAQLVNKFCDDHQIPSGWLKKPDLVEIYASAYEIRGGGWVELSLNQKKIKFYSQSSAYGKYDFLLLKQIVIEQEFLKEYIVEYS